ncbi:hypothetical protein BGZ74_005527, partial [Mortierella antarctica]
MNDLEELEDRVHREHEDGGNGPDHTGGAGSRAPPHHTTTTPTHNSHVAQPRERILSTPRKFLSGEDPLVWLDDFNLIAKGNNWHQATKLNTVGLYLGGTAQKWYTSNHTIWTTFGAFADAFEGRYLTHALKAKARVAAQEYRQGPDQTVDE